MWPPKVGPCISQESRHRRQLTDKAAKQAKRTVKEINDNIEHSTLGDLEVLAGLKENLEKQEKAQKGE